MSSILNKFWFRLVIKDVSLVNYLTYALTAEDALKAFGVLGQDRHVELLSWGDFSELTGSVIPTQCETETPANGNLMYDYNKKLIVIWNKIS